MVLSPPALTTYNRTRRLPSKGSIGVYMRRVLSLALLLLMSASAGAQSRAGKTSTPRTPWGHPDLQGVWNYWTFTPLERPNEFANRSELTDEESARLAQQLHQRALQTDQSAPAAGDPGPYSQGVWTDGSKAPTV